jgi:membrane protein implicated in regulation of membrane protease activity
MTHRALCTERGDGGRYPERSAHDVTRRARTEAVVITVDLANSIFIGCLLVGGILLLITVIAEELLGGLFDALHLSFDLGGVALMPVLLGFISMFGVGGLFGTQVFELDAGRASLVGAVTGLLGAGVVFVTFGFLQRAEAPEAFSLRDLVGQRGRVSVSIRAGRAGSVLLSYAGSSHDLTATADTDIEAGTVVVITDVAGSTVVVERAPAAVHGATGPSGESAIIEGGPSGA